MIYLTEKFPPIADLHWTPDGSSYQYTFHYRKWELAHCIFQLSADEKILYIAFSYTHLTLPTIA